MLSQLSSTSELDILGCVFILSCICFFISTSYEHRGGFSHRFLYHFDVSELKTISVLVPTDTHSILKFKLDSLQSF